MTSLYMIPVSSPEYLAPNLRNNNFCKNFANLITKTIYIVLTDAVRATASPLGETTDKCAVP